MSWKYEVATRFNGVEDWSTNACVFASHKEAEAAGKELLSRWTMPHDYRVVSSDKPVNYRFNFETNRPESLT